MMSRASWGRQRCGTAMRATIRPMSSTPTTDPGANQAAGSTWLVSNGYIAAIQATAAPTPPASTASIVRSRGVVRLRPRIATRARSSGALPSSRARIGPSTSSMRQGHHGSATTPNASELSATPSPGSSGTGANVAMRRRMRSLPCVSGGSSRWYVRHPSARRNCATERAPRSRFRSGGGASAGRGDVRRRRSQSGWPPLPSMTIAPRRHDQRYASVGLRSSSRNSTRWPSIRGSSLLSATVGRATDAPPMSATNPAAMSATAMIAARAAGRNCTRCPASVAATAASAILRRTAAGPDPAPSGGSTGCVCHRCTTHYHRVGSLSSVWVDPAGLRQRSS